MTTIAMETKENFSKRMDLRTRCKAAGIHFSLTALIGTMAAILVFGIWYPWPYRTISGGLTLFLLIVSVDLTLGPMLTFVAFHGTKAKRLLILDLCIIATLQLSGLIYGLHTVYLARPVAIVFEGTRFRVVSDVEVSHDELPKALPEYRELSITGPKLLGTRDPNDNKEKIDSVLTGFSGLDLGMRPSFWQSYDKSAQAALAKARPLTTLFKQYPASRNDTQNEVKRTGRKSDQLKFLPVIAKDGDWSALLDARTGAVVGFVPYDGFF